MRAAPLVLALAAALALAGCGKKAKLLDAPQGKDADRFPQTYPNPQGLNSGARTLPSTEAGAGTDTPVPAEIAPGVQFP